MLTSHSCSQLESPQASKEALERWSVLKTDVFTRYLRNNLADMSFAVDRNNLADMSFAVDRKCVL